MDSKAALAAFLAESVTPFLRERGFHRTGQRYWAKRGPNLITVAFQLSRWQRGHFTCNLSTISAFLIEEFGDMPPEHWSIRLGPPIVGYDKWWNLELSATILADDFLPTLGKGVDYVEPFASDEGLRDALLRAAMEDPRPLPPVMEQWALALIRKLGPGPWGDWSANRRG